MDLAEVAELLKPIKQNYPFFDASQGAREHYLKYLKDFPFDIAQQNVDHHIMTEKNPPTVAHIRGQLADQNQHDELKEVAEDLASQIEEWKLTATPMPDHVREALKKLGDKFRV
jgi:hypothetical protein